MHNLNTEQENVKEPEKIRDLYNTCFAGKPAYLKYYKNDIRIICHNYSMGHVVIGIPYIKAIPEPAVIFAFNDQFAVQLVLKKTAIIQQDIIQFKIMKCSLSPSSRSFRRNTIDFKSENKKILYITNFVTETVINNGLILNHNKINSVLNYAEEKLKKKFLYVKICTGTDAQHDPRMQYIYSNHEGYVISRIGKNNIKKNPAYDYYMSYIYPVDRIIKTGVYRISEALFPIFYRNKIPYGYLRINKETEINEAELQLAVNFVKSIEQHFCKTGVIPVAKEKVIIRDISPGGFSILQHQKKNIRLFKNGSILCFDLILPENREINILGKITYNSPTENGLLRSGLKIEKIDDADMNEFLNYIDSFSIDN